MFTEMSYVSFRHQRIWTPAKVVGFEGFGETYRYFAEGFMNKFIVIDLRRARPYFWIDGQQKPRWFSGLHGNQR
jgi:hypothetical protein